MTGPTRGLPHSRMVLFIVIACVGGIAAGLASLRILLSIDSLGEHIPKTNLVPDYVFAVVWAIILGASILFWFIPMSHKRDLLICWLFRMFTTLGFMLLVESWYPGADAYEYFVWARDDDFNWTGFHLGQGNENITTLVWLQELVLPSSFHALKVTFSFVGMMAAYLFYRSVVLVLGREDRRLLFLLNVMPSILYWSSIVGKDPISLLGMGIYTYGVIASYQKGSARYLPMTLLGVLIVTYIRSWYGPMMIIPLLAFILAPSNQTSHRGILVRLSGLPVLGVSFVVFWTNSKFSDSFASTDALLKTTTSINASYASGGSATQATEFASIGDLVLNLPFRIFTALLRPLPGEIMAPFGLLAGFENLIMVCWLGLLFVFAKNRHFRDPIILWLMIFTLLWATQYGLTTAGNLGSLVRYRLQVLPIMVMLFIFLSVPPRLGHAPSTEPNPVPRHRARRVQQTTSPERPRQTGQINHSPTAPRRRYQPTLGGTAQTAGGE